MSSLISEKSIRFFISYLVNLVNIFTILNIIKKLHINNNANSSLSIRSVGLILVEVNLFVVTTSIKKKLYYSNNNINHNDDDDGGGGISSSSMTTRWRFKPKCT